MKKKNLKFCPCCGNSEIESAEFYHVDKTIESGIVKCKKCGLKIQGKTLRSAIVRWNKRPDTPPSRIRAIGNKGGDYIDITVEKRDEDEIEDQIIVEIGHCCVVIARHSMPVSVFTGLIGSLYMDFNDPYDFYKKLEWDDDFIAKLVSRVEKIDCFYGRAKIEEDNE